MLDMAHCQEQGSYSQVKSNAILSNSNSRCRNGIAKGYVTTTWLSPAWGSSPGDLAGCSPVQSCYPEQTGQSGSGGLTNVLAAYWHSADAQCHCLIAGTLACTAQLVICSICLLYTLLSIAKIAKYVVWQCHVQSKMDFPSRHVKSIVCCQPGCLSMQASRATAESKRCQHTSMYGT